MTIFEIILTIYIVLSYIVVGYVLLVDRKSNKISLIDVVLWAVAPFILPMILIIAGKFAYDDYKNTKQRTEGKSFEQNKL